MDGMLDDIELDHVIVPMDNSNNTLWSMGFIILKISEIVRRARISIRIRICIGISGYPHRIGPSCHA